MEAALTFISRFCRQPDKVPSRLVAMCHVKIFPFSLFPMESIITQLTQQEVWEGFLAYRLKKGRFNWREFEEADDFVGYEQYLPLATKVAKAKIWAFHKRKSSTRWEQAKNVWCIVFHLMKYCC